MFKNFVDSGRQMEGHLLADRLGNVFEVGFVAGREHDFGQSGPVGGKHLLLHAADRKHFALQA